MDDLISRQSVLDALWLKYCNRPLDSDRYLIKDIRDIINSLPSAQPEIIRCKDCLIHGVCRFEVGLGMNGYCSQAERRTDE